jgi:hypothetical protein
MKLYMKSIKMIVLMAALTLAWGCSSEDDNNSSASDKYTTVASPTAPGWGMDWHSNDNRPTWTAPDPSLFETSMVLLMEIEEELMPYAGKNDLTSAYIDGECRALSQCNYLEPDAENGLLEPKAYFTLAIRGTHTEADKPVTINYYCQELKQLFSIENVFRFVPELVYGMNEEFAPPFLRYTTKYPVQDILQIELPQNMPFVVSEDDKIAFFVGDECRGVEAVKVDEKDGTVFGYTYAKQVGETINIRYYSKQQALVYYLKQTIAATGQTQKIKLDI